MRHNENRMKQDLITFIVLKFRANILYVCGKTKNGRMMRKKTLSG
jgi:hypothetical protein